MNIIIKYDIIRYNKINFYIINATLTLDGNIVLHEKQAKLEKEIAKLKEQARAEKQPKNKFELVQKIKH